MTQILTPDLFVKLGGKFSITETAIGFSCTATYTNEKLFRTYTGTSTGPDLTKVKENALLNLLTHRKKHLSVEKSYHGIDMKDIFSEYVKTA